jgi:hypothetical protein
MMLTRTVSQESADDTETDPDDGINYYPTAHRFLIAAAGRLARAEQQLLTAVPARQRPDATAGLRKGKPGVFRSYKGRAVSPEPSPCTNTPHFPYFFGIFPSRFLARLLCLGGAICLERHQREP